MIFILMITITSNIAQVLAPIQQQLASMQVGGELYGTVMRTVSTSMLGVVRTRIHEQGKAADGSDIGVYSKKPTYISAKQNPGKSFGRPTGKTGKSKFASGKKKGQDHKSKYFPLGYNQYKTEIGRNKLGKVNLSLSGQLNSQLNVQATANGGYGLGWPNDEMLKRAGYLETKYKKQIWALTEEETTQAATVAQNALNRALSV